MDDNTTPHAEQRFRYPGTALEFAKRLEGRQRAEWKRAENERYKSGFPLLGLPTIVRDNETPVLVEYYGYRDVEVFDSELQETRTATQSYVGMRFAIDPLSDTPDSIYVKAELLHEGFAEDYTEILTSLGQESVFAKQQEYVQYSPPQLIGEYIFNGTPEQFATVVNALRTDVCDPLQIDCYEEKMITSLGRYPESKRNPNHATFYLTIGRIGNRLGAIDALTRPGNQATVIVKLYPAVLERFTMNEWIRYHAKDIRPNRPDNALERVTAAWDALRAAITRHGYTFTPLGESQETMTTTTPDARENTRASRTELRTFYAYCRWLLGDSDKEIEDDWKRLYQLEMRRTVEEDHVDALQAIEAARKRLKKVYLIERPKEDK